MSKSKTKLARVPRPLLVISVVSVTLNVLLGGWIAVGYIVQESGELDYAIANQEMNVMCSDRFRDRLIKTGESRGESENEIGIRVATVDFPCVKNGARDYYEKGFTAYTESLGLKL